MQCHPARPDAEQMSRLPFHPVTGKLAWGQSAVNTLSSRLPHGRKGGRQQAGEELVQRLGRPAGDTMVVDDGVATVWLRKSSETDMDRTTVW
jgi:hypothetical protein